MAKILVSGTDSALMALLTTLAGRSDIVAEIVSSEPTPARGRAIVDEPAPEPRQRRTINGRVKYHVTRRGRAVLDRGTGAGPKAMRVLARIAEQPSGLGELQHWFGRQSGARYIKPKTVDGSVTQLKNADLIRVESVE